MPHLLQEDTSIVSEESSIWGDDREQYNVELSWNDLKFLEQLSQEIANRGTPKAEVQLRYVDFLFRYQMFANRACLI